MENPIKFEAGDVDGGITILDGGEKARVVLDSRGIFKGHALPSAIPVPASSLDQASARALQTMPAARVEEVPRGPAGGGQGQGGPGAQGFQVGG
jgi:hypothetical protein